ncbi:MAG: DUF5655 domain-containing protein [Lawsonibacter sp.]|jgi:hypothetical protein
MQVPEHYTSDVLCFFEGKPLELSLYQALTERMAEVLPDDISVKVQKTQISFYARRLFAAASLPVRRKKDWPRECLVVTIGLARPLSSPRAAVSVEPYPGRWTNHILITRPEEVDGELIEWLREAHSFALSKR